VLRRHRLVAVVVLATLPALAAAAGAGRRPAALPAELPAPVRARLAGVVDEASLAARVEGRSFVARPDVFEYLLDHPEFATHVTRALRTARYRIWRTPDGLMLDDGWGTVGSFEVVYGAPGVRVLYVKGEYRHRILPDIRGRAVVTIDWVAAAGPQGKTVIAPTVGAFVKVDGGGLASMARALAGSMAEAKAEKEASRLVRVFQKTTRILDDSPAAALETLRQRPDTPRRELEEFARLLSRPAAAGAPGR
jgi:hypothetical protein